MRHQEVDRHARDSRLYGIDARVKLIGTLVFITSVSLLRTWEPLIICSMFILAIAAFSGVPTKHFLLHFSLSLPFIIFASISMWYSSSPEQAGEMMIRISVSVLALLVMVSTTSFLGILRALRSLRVPEILASLLLFTYRFIFVFMEEMENMRLARRARGFSGRGNMFQRNIMRTISYTAGMLLVRSYSRAQRIYDGLLIRGYDGEIRTFDDGCLGGKEVVYAMAFTGVSVISLGLQTGLVIWTL